MNEPGKPQSKHGWRIVRHVFIALAILATLVAVFYTEEDWRGKHAWENCKRQLEAQGVVLDWNKFLPPSVPDDENFYTASTNILQKFKQAAPGDPNLIAIQTNPWLRLHPTSSNSYTKMDSPVVAKFIVTRKVDGNFEPGTNSIVVNLDDPTASQRCQKFIENVIGPNKQGVAGPQFYLFDLRNVRPAQIYVQNGKLPSASEMQKLIPSNSRLIVVYLAGQKTFEAVAFRPAEMVSAADYLKWSDQFVPAFDEIREALKRPYAILPGDYSNPASMPIPNFVTLRALAETLGQRAQCYLLLGEPDKALHALTLIHEVCRILEKPPSSQPETLVEAMIKVAITGLYEQVIAEGLQRHDWQEQQLIQLQKQLNKSELCPFLFEALREEPAHINRVVEISSPPDWGFSKSIRWPVPRGWLYQMLVVAENIECKAMAAVDFRNNTVSPKKLNETMNEINKSINGRSFFNLLARIMAPNFEKAWQTAAYNQTLVNETQIACALERYRLAHGAYPESLHDLVPQFIETVPHDIIGGQPLHYRLTQDGKFLLYSIGWNEKDDGGQKLPRGKYGRIGDYSKGDWVWPGLD